MVVVFCRALELARAIIPPLIDLFEHSISYHCDPARRQCGNVIDVLHAVNVLPMHGEPC